MNTLDRQCLYHCLYRWRAGMAQWLRALAFRHCGPGSIPGLRRSHMWVEFVVGSRPCSEGFSPGSPVFLPPQKPTFLNSNSTLNARSPSKRAPKALWCSVCKQITFTSYRPMQFTTENITTFITCKKQGGTQSYKKYTWK